MLIFTFMEQKNIDLSLDTLRGVLVFCGKRVLLQLNLKFLCRQFE